MNPYDSLSTKRAALSKKAERLRGQLAAIDTEISEIDTAIRVFERYIVDEVGKQLRDEAAPPEPKGEAEAAEVRDAEEETAAESPFALVAPSEKTMTRKERVQAATPRGYANRVGPKELTELVNAKFGTAYTPNHVRPLIWALAQGGPARAEEGKYWIEEDQD
jgi:hypothetical protein